MPRMMPRSVIVRTGISGSGTVSSTAMIAASSVLGFSTTAPMAATLHPFGRERDSLADTDAHGGECELAAVALQLFGRGQREAGARHAERVAERNRAAIGIHARVVISDSKLAKDGEPLGSEGLVQLDDVEVGDLVTETPN